MHLENEYIKERKAEEHKKAMAHREELIKRGVKNLPHTPEEAREHILAHK